MIDFRGRGILLDIEGTTSSVSFVYDVMFPFVRRELKAFFSSHWGTQDLTGACELVARDAGHESFAAWSMHVATDQERQQLVADEITRLMDGDIKATGLKQLPGLTWQADFESGELRTDRGGVWLARRRDSLYQRCRCRTGCRAGGETTNRVMHSAGERQGRVVAGAR